MNGDKRFGTWEDAVSALRADPDQQALVEGAYYDDPLLGAAERYRVGEEWQAIGRLLDPKRGMALDVGAGRGIASYALAREGYEVTALEPDPSALVGAAAIRDLATEAGVAIHVVETFSEQLPFADASFDLVFARAVLHHTVDLAQACAEFARVLKPGGQFIAVREHVISRHEDLPAFLALHPLHALYGGENAFLLDEYRRAIEAAGLSIERQLAPLESPINYAPQTLASLRAEIADRVAKLPVLGGVAKNLAQLPGVAGLLLALARLADNRPGRHYSFVCRKAG